MFGLLPKGHKLFKRLGNALIKLRVYAGWSEPLLVSHTALLELNSAMIPLFFIPESCVSDNPIRYERPRILQMYHGTTRNDPRFRYGRAAI